MLSNWEYRDRTCEIMDSESTALPTWRIPKNDRARVNYRVFELIEACDIP